MLCRMVLRRSILPRCPSCFHLRMRRTLICFHSLNAICSRACRSDADNIEKSVVRIRSTALAPVVCFTSIDTSSASRGIDRDNIPCGPAAFRTARTRGCAFVSTGITGFQYCSNKRSNDSTSSLEEQRIAQSANLTADRSVMFTTRIASTASADSLMPMENPFARRKRQKPMRFSVIGNSEVIKSR